MQNVDHEYQPWVVVAGDRPAPVARLARMLSRGLAARVWTASVPGAVNKAGRLLPDLVVLFPADGQSHDTAMAIERIARLPVWVPTLAIADATPDLRQLTAGADDTVQRPVDREALCEAALRLIRLRRGALSLGALEPTAAADEATGLLPAIVALPLLEGAWDSCVASDRPFSIVVAQVEQLRDIECAHGPRVANVVRREIIRQLAAAFDPEHVFAASRDTIAIALPDASPEFGFHRLERLERRIADALELLPLDLEAPSCHVRISSSERRADGVTSIQELLLCALSRLASGGVELIAA